MSQPNQQSDPNWFGELLAVIHDEELIRLRRRLQNAGNHRLADVLTDELEDREPNLWNPLNSSKADPSPSTP
jgi:hypothetical protein